MGIFGKIVHRYRVFKSVRRETKKARSSHWPVVRTAHLHDSPNCAACGGNLHVQVHHIEPFNEKPELELEPTNLISLCMGLHECHIRIGHGGSFDHFNPRAKVDAATVLAHPEKRAGVEAAALSGRLPNVPEAR